MKKNEKVRLIIFVCEIITTFAIPALFAFWDQITLVQCFFDNHILFSSIF